MLYIWRNSKECLNVMKIILSTLNLFLFLPSKLPFTSSLSIQSAFSISALMSNFVFHIKFIESLRSRIKSYMKLTKYSVSLWESDAPSDLFSLGIAHARSHLEYPYLYGILLTMCMWSVLKIFRRRTGRRNVGDFQIERLFFLTI